MKLKKILLTVLVLVVLFALVACGETPEPTPTPQGHTHNYGTFIAQQNATCAQEGVVGHYHCDGCGKDFDVNKQELATTVIPRGEHNYGTLIPQQNATYSATGVVEHYHCDGCGKDFDKSKQEIADVTIPCVTVKSYALNNSSIKEFDVSQLTEALLLSSIKFDVTGTDDSVVTVSPTAVKNFSAKVGASQTFTFTCKLADTVSAEMSATVDVYAQEYVLLTKDSILKDGNQIIFVSTEGKALSTTLDDNKYYTGETVERHGDKLQYAVLPATSHVIVFTLKTSVEAGSFNIVLPEGKCLKSGNNPMVNFLGEIPTADKDDTTRLASSWDITFNASNVAVIHGRMYGYSYIRYAQDTNRFFITNSASYKNDVYLYRLEKTFETDAEGQHVHYYGDLVPEVKATCTTTGTQAHYECSCGKYFVYQNGQYVEATAESLIIPVNANAHTYGNLIAETKPTCAQTGAKAHYECACGKWFVYQDGQYVEVNPSELIAPIDTNSHAYGDLIAESASTCIKAGVKAHYQCAICKAFFNESKQQVDFETLLKPVGEHALGELVSATQGKCMREGYAAHYNCAFCGKYFDESKKIVDKADLATPAPGHNYNGTTVCINCGAEKPLSVADAIALKNQSTPVTVQGVVIGCTGNYDGGYVWVLIKDLETNATSAIRKCLNTEFDKVARDIASGSSYAPSMYFSLGDIVEIPVFVKTGTATQGGEAGKTFFVFAGDSVSSKAEASKYVVGTCTNYRMDKTQVVATIDSQETLEAFVSPLTNTFKLVKITGTTEKPLKITTQSATTAGKNDINREYLYLFYDEPTKLDDVKVNGSSPVLSNFGNRFNLSAPLSTILLGQTGYEGLNFTKPYEFVGDIYCMIIGGSTAYYHFVVMNEGDIEMANKPQTEVIDAKTAKNTFFDYMENYAAQIGIDIGKSITSAIGVSYVVSAEDLCRVAIAAYNTPAMQQFYNAPTRQVTIEKDNGTVITPNMTNGVLASETCQKYIMNKYEIIGTKGGSLAGTTETRPFEVMNNIMIVKGPDNTVMVGVAVMNRANSASETDDPYYNVYLELDKVFQIMIKKHNHEDTTELENSILAYSCAGVMIPADHSAQNGYDWFGSGSQYVHYSSEKGAEKIITASCWKMFTGTCFLSVVPENLLDTVVTFGASEENSMVNKAPDLKAGYKLTLRDALYIMMVPSSNDAPSFLARFAGEYLITNGLFEGH